MAVSEMKKFSVICPLDETDKLIRKLMWLSCVDIKEHPRADDDNVYERLDDIDAQIAENNRLLLKIKEVMATLASYDCKRWAEQIPVRAKKKLFSPPNQIDFDEFVNAGRYDIAISKLEKISNLTRLLAEKKDEYNSLSDEYARISAWKKYDVPLNIRHTLYSDITLGMLGRKADIKSICATLEAENLVSVYKIGEDKYSQYISIVSHKSDTEKALSKLSDMGFVKAELPELECTASELLVKLEAELEEKLNEEQSIQEQIASFVGIEGQLEATYDIISTNIVELEAKKQILRVGSVCIIDGWVPVESSEKLEKLFKSNRCAYELAEPSEDDNVPIVLKNNAFASAFEPVISLYSLPRYKTFDPTFIMSIFYVIIFGLMFADVGYGLILALGCFLAIKLIYPRGTMKKFFQMFAICGLSCAFWGFIMGGYFGDLLNTVFGVEANLAIWFDPIQDPMTFLVLSIVVGAVHMIAGMIVKMVVLIKQKQTFSAIFDVGSWIVIFIGIALAILNTKIGLAVALIGVLMLIFTQGRAQKNIFMKIFKGIGSLYSITSYASDLLSYTRILSLGLASAVIAKVINVIASLAGGNIVGYLLLIVVLLVGHALNMAINLLGTFVHASRLQYIEFFGKFYDEGGTPFNLVAPKNKYVLFKEKKDI